MRDDLAQMTGAPPPDGTLLERFRITPAQDGVWELRCNRSPEIDRGHQSDVIARLLERINVLACFTNKELSVHSGLVADEAGNGIWVIAPSGGGKSTLTAQLALSGLHYLTDELAIVEHGDDELLSGWLKWIALKGRSRNLMHQHIAPDVGIRSVSGARWFVPPRALGGSIPHLRVRPALVVLPAYRQGAPTQLQKVSRAYAVESIALQTFRLRSMGPTAIERLAAAVAESTCLVATYGDGWEAAHRLIDMLAEGDSR